MEKTTRYIGTCGACKREIKVRDGVLVHHGYRRPGHGFIEGDCMGALRAPHETSSEVADAYGEAVAEALAAAVEALASFPEADYSYAKVRAENREYLLRGAVADHRRFLAAWTPRPLRSVEEEKAAKRAAVEVRKAEKRAAKAEKLAKKIASFQKRIDAAAKKGRNESLANLWEDLQRNLRRDFGLSYEEALAAVDRNALWAEKGLGGFVLPSFRAPWDCPENVAFRALRGY